MLRKSHLNHMQKLHIYNTLRRTKEVFTPIEKDFVRMYVCGPTVYGDAHLGHAKSYLTFDIVLRYLRYLNYQVRYVQNITDVGHLTDDADEGEDKLARQSRLERKEPMEIAEKYTYNYFRDMDAMGILRPDISPRASGHIPEQIAMIKVLIEKNHAYVADGNVYYDVSSKSDYGKLSGRKLDEAESGTRVHTAGDKRQAADFALWKKADDSHIMKWDSPWSVGYPGWHIECSAMASKYLGETIDIHGGGLENQFPHHECEIAQCEAAHDKEFVRYWMHNNMVTLNGQKMGKSLGNAISLNQFFDGSHPLLTRAWKPEVIRFFLLQSHYRSTTDFSEPALLAAENGLKNLHEIISSISNAENGSGDAFDLSSFIMELEARMNDDFNTATTLALLYEKLKPVRASILRGDHPKNTKDLADFLQRFVQGVLGIWPSETADSGAQNEHLTEGLISLLLDMRKDARDRKDWASSDAIRDRLSDLGIQIKDSPNGTTWSFH